MTQRTGQHLNKHIYYKAHINNDAVMQVGKTRMQLFKANAGRGQNTSKTKSQQKQCKKCYDRPIINYSQALSISLLVGHGATSFTQRKARKNPLKDKGVDGTS